MVRSIIAVVLARPCAASSPCGPLSHRAFTTTGYPWAANELLTTCGQGRCCAMSTRTNDELSETVGRQPNRDARDKRLGPPLSISAAALGQPLHCVQLACYTARPCFIYSRLSNVLRPYISSALLLVSTVRSCLSYLLAQCDNIALRDRVPSRSPTDEFKTR